MLFCTELEKALLSCKEGFLYITIVLCKRIVIPLPAEHRGWRITPYMGDTKCMIREETRISCGQQLSHAEKLTSIFLTFNGCVYAYEKTRGGGSPDL